MITIRLRLVVLVLVLASAMVAESKLLSETKWGFARLSGASHWDKDQLAGDIIYPEDEMMMDSEAARRVLAQATFISYDALRANTIPCSRRGRSYYNCNQLGRANPYTRGCSFITNCGRYTT